MDQSPNEAEKELRNRVISLASYIKMAGGHADFVSGSNAPASDDWEQLLHTMRQDDFDALADKSPAVVFDQVITEADTVINAAYHKAILEDGIGADHRPSAARVLDFVCQDLALPLHYLLEHDPDVCYRNAMTYLTNEIADVISRPQHSLSRPTQPPAQVQAMLDQPAPQPALPTVTTHALPTQFFSTTDNVSNTTFNDAEEKHALITRKGAKYTTDVNTGRSYRTSLSIDFDAWGEDDIQLSNGRTLGVYERAVHDAVCTLFQDGNMEYITPSMIYRIMTGRDASKLTPKQINEILNALRKLIRTFVTIKESSVKSKDGLAMSIESSLLDGEIVEVQLYGKRATVLRVKSEPILLGYASNKNQITRADLSLFRIEGIKGYSQDVLLLVQSLWHRIHIMMSKSKSGINHTILFTSLYKHLDLNGRYTGASLYNKRSWVRKNCELILEYWKKIHFIADYEPQRDGAEYVGYTITTMDGTLLESPISD